LRAIDHVNVAIHHNRLAGANVMQCAIHGAIDPIEPHLLHGHDQIAGRERIIVHGLAVGETCKAHLRDIRPRESVLDQRAHGIAVAEALIRVSHVEMGIERDQADFFQWQAKAEDARPRDRIVPANEQSQLVDRSAQFDRVADRPGRLLDHQSIEIDVSAVTDVSSDFASRLDVVATDAPQGPAKHLGSEVAIARSNRSRCKRSAHESDRRAFLFADDQLGKVRPAAHRFALGSGTGP